MAYRDYESKKFSKAPDPELTQRATERASAQRKSDRDVREYQAAKKKRDAAARAQKAAKPTEAPKSFTKGVASYGTQTTPTQTPGGSVSKAEADKLGLDKEVTAKAINNTKAAQADAKAAADAERKRLTRQTLNKKLNQNRPDIVQDLETGTRLDAGQQKRMAALDAEEAELKQLKKKLGTDFSSDNDAQKPVTEEPSFANKGKKAVGAAKEGASKVVKNAVDKVKGAGSAVRHPVRTVRKMGPGAGKGGLIGALGGAAHEINARIDEGDSLENAVTGFAKDTYQGAVDGATNAFRRYGKMWDEGRYLDAGVSVLGDVANIAAETGEGITDVVGATYEGATTDKPFSQAWRDAQADRGFFGRRADVISPALDTIAGVRNPQAAPTAAAADPTPAAVAVAPYEAAAAAQAQQGAQAPTPTGTTVDPANGAHANAGDQVVIPTGGTAAAVAPTIQTNDGITDQVGDTDFTRQRGSFGVRYDDGQGNYMTSKSPGAGGGTVTTIQGMKPGEARAILDRPFRGARAPASASPRFGGGGGSPGLSWGERKAIREAQMISPKYRSQNLTKAQNAAQMQDVLSRRQLKLQEAGINPETGVPNRLAGSGGGASFKDGLAMAKFNRDNAQNAFKNNLEMLKFQQGVGKDKREAQDKMIQGLNSDDAGVRSQSYNQIIANANDPAVRAYADQMFIDEFAKSRGADSGPIDAIMNLFGVGQTPEGRIDLDNMRIVDRPLLDNVIKLIDENTTNGAWGNYAEIDSERMKFLARYLAARNGQSQ